MQSRRSRFLLSLSALATLALGACGAPKASDAPNLPSVGVIRLTDQSASLLAQLPGRVVAAETSEVRPQVSGIIRKRLFKEGAYVEAGQILYQIEDAPYRAAVGTAQGNLAVARASIRSTQLQAERYDRLLKIKGVSQQDVDNAQAAAGEARATVQARSAELDAARVNLGFTQIRAPISGRISRSLLTVGALAQTGQDAPLATIQNIGEVFVDISEPAGDLLDLREAIREGGVTRDTPEAAKVELLLPNGKTYPVQGTLEFSEVSVDQSSGSVTVRARFPNPDGTLLPGMYVKARLVKGVRRHAVLAPQQGVTHNEKGEPVALVLNAKGVVEQRKLTTQGMQGNTWIVTEGLKPGDRLIVEGILGVRPGEKANARRPQQVAANEVPDAPARD